MPAVIIASGNRRRMDFAKERAMGVELDQSDLLHRILGRAAQNLTIEKLFYELHLDLNNISFSEVFQRAIEIGLANINIANACALIGAAFYAVTFLTPTMVRLRVFGILSAFFFVAYGLLGGVLSTVLLFLKVPFVNV